jgi:hypothetical protein
MRFCTLQEQYSNAMNNYKAYDELLARRLDSANAKNYELKLTKEQLEYSQDSVIQKLNEVRKELKIKQKNIERLEYIYENTIRHDSIFLFDTILRDGVSIDTTLADEWRVLNLKLMYPNKIDIKTEFRNELSVVVSSEKQTINPPSKIFFIRWFQRKQKLIKIDVVDSNPYASVKEQRFVEIVK